MAGLLWDHFLPAAVRRVLSESVGGSDAEGRVLACWAAAVHDIGKASPDFAQQSPMRGLLDTMRDFGMDVRPDVKHGHATVGQVVLESWLKERFGCPPMTATTFACVIGGHHGANPTDPALQAVRARPHRVGSGAWVTVRNEILDSMAAHTGADVLLPRWLKRRLPVPAQVLLTGLVIVADWMSSDEALFPYADPTSAETRAAEAFDALAIPEPWRAAEAPVDPTVHLHERFPALSHVMARPLQMAAVSAARQATRPPLIIIEGPMGIGKTESALMSSEVLARRFGCGGVFVGLPTMATSNPMFDRVLAWLRLALQAQDASVALAHGKAALNETYDRLRGTGHHITTYDDDPVSARVLVTEWLRGRKRAGLASFVVGTIDQSLFAGLKSKHVALRHLGLAGKVVIIDEVHAADDYMRRYLTRVLTWLGAYGTPVILMSATLPPEQRDEFVNAYAAGSDDGVEIITGDRADLPTRLTLYDGDLHTLEVDPGSAASRVSVKRLDDGLDALVSTLRAALTDGGCAGVICNTVARAQEAFEALAPVFGSDVIVAHSRFIAPHRARREASLVRTLGPGDDARPRRLVVVGTQVLEQSLDIDFDLMVTDLAPIDLILQRLGRLHRHPRQGRPSPVAEPVVWLRGVEDWSGVPPIAAKGSQAVYGAKRLLRAAAVLNELSSLELPRHIPRLVRLAYDPDLAPPPGWQDAWLPAEGKAYSDKENAINKASAYLLGDPWSPVSLNGWMDVLTRDPDRQEAQGHSQVRDSDDGLEVIALFRDSDGELRLPKGLHAHAGRLIPSSGLPWGTGQEASAARAMAACTLRLPAAMCFPGVIDKVVADLERQIDHSGWQGSPWIAGQLALGFDTSGKAAVAGFDLRYDPKIGLTFTRQESAQ